MAPFRPQYPPELRRQMVELVRIGRTPGDLSREFEPHAQMIRRVGEAGPRGRRASAPTLQALQSAMNWFGGAVKTIGCGHERDILSKAAVIAARVVTVAMANKAARMAETHRV